MVGIEGLSEDVIFTWCERLIEQCRDPMSGSCIFPTWQKENNSN